MGTGDEMPAALARSGRHGGVARRDELAWGDLSRYNAIFIGVRAYDSREDLRANNKRVLDYASAGGTVIVQYNRGNTWTQYAPFPARFSNTRVTDENGEVQVLASDDPVFHYPNEIGEAAWRNWVQERGTYFIVPDDQRYTDLIQVHEPFEHNAGWKKGALVTRECGEGPLDFRRPRPVAAGGGRHRRRVSAAGESRQPRQTPGKIGTITNRKFRIFQSSDLPICQYCEIILLPPGYRFRFRSELHINGTRSSGSTPAAPRGFRRDQRRSGGATASAALLPRWMRS